MTRAMPAVPPGNGDTGSRLAEQTPTLCEWAGGEEALRRLIDAFYDRVERDELLSPLVALPPTTPRCPGTQSFARPWSPTSSGERVALQNSQPSAEVAERAPVPRWGWCEAPPFAA
jgi:hypothetical protein